MFDGNVSDLRGINTLGKVRDLRLYLPVDDMIVFEHPTRTW